MKYTIQQLQGMPDREIDCALCEKVTCAKVVGKIFNGASHFVATTKKVLIFLFQNTATNGIA